MADVSRRKYPVLIPVSRSYPEAKGRLLTCYSPVRRSSTPKGLSARLACVKHAASVRPEPGSNSPLNVYMQTAGTLRRPAVRAADMRDVSSGWRTSHGDDLGIRRWRPGRHRPGPLDGVCACALAFSTLLSSQGADAHHRRLFSLYP